MIHPTRAIAQRCYFVAISNQLCEKKLYECGLICCKHLFTLNSNVPKTVYIRKTKPILYQLQSLNITKTLKKLDKIINGGLVLLANVVKNLLHFKPLLQEYWIIKTSVVMALQSIRQFYLEIPPVTRFYTTACVITTLAVHLDLVSPLQLYFHPSLILRRLQLWRLATTFLFFGSVGISFFFNMVFTYRYCRMLEEGSFRGRSSDFVMMFLFGGALMTFFGLFVNLLFLGQAFTLMLVYVWSRRNPFVRMNFFGVMYFQAPYLPWVLLCCSMILGNTIWVDIIGMGVGHIYYFLEDVFPFQRNGYKFLKTPNFLKVLFNEHIDRNYQPLPEDRPGGFNWGGEEVEGQPAPLANNDEAVEGAQNPDDNNDQRAARPAQN